MTDRREQLMRDEDAEWAKFCQAIGDRSDAELQRPWLGPDQWSTKDLMFHVGAWMAECGRMLERIRAGTFDRSEEDALDTDAKNREWHGVSRGLDLLTVRVELAASRSRMLEEFGHLPEVTGDALEWFEESGPIHYREHTADLRAWHPEA
jgi:hypothetical protein